GKVNGPCGIGGEQDQLCPRAALGNHGVAIAVRLVAADGGRAVGGWQRWRGRNRDCRGEFLPDRLAGNVNGLDNVGSSKEITAGIVGVAEGAHNQAVGDTEDRAGAAWNRTRAPGCKGQELRPGLNVDLIAAIQAGKSQRAGLISSNANAK